MIYEDRRCGKTSRMMDWAVAHARAGEKVLVIATNQQERDRLASQYVDSNITIMSITAPQPFFQQSLAGISFDAIAVDPDVHVKKRQNTLEKLDMAYERLRARRQPDMSLHEAIERVSAMADPTTSNLSADARTAISLVLERMHLVDVGGGRGAPRNDMVRISPLGGSYRDVPVCKHDSAITIGSLVISAMEIT